jgi:hypothetical protein
MQPNNPDSKQPVEGQPQNIQPVGRMIQPLSSEDDIRKAAEAARAEQPAPSQAVNQASPSTPTNTSSVEPTNVYEQSNLVTEPIRRSSQVAQPQFQVASPQPSSQSAKSSKGIFIVVGLIIVAALAIGAYFFLFNNKIAVSDLVQETFQQTTFLRPKQWSSTGSEGGFGDLKGKSGKSSAAVSVKESQQASPVSGASDAMYDQLRTQLVNQASVAAIEPAFRNTGEACKSDITLKAEPDVKKTKTAIGLSTLVGSCTREDGDFTIKIRTVAGISDGQIRAIALGARNVDWDTNSEAFQAILDSVGQANN